MKRAATFDGCVKSWKIVSCMILNELKPKFTFRRVIHDKQNLPWQPQPAWLQLNLIVIFSKSIIKGLMDQPKIKES